MRWTKVSRGALRRFGTRRPAQSEFERLLKGASDHGWSLGPANRSFLKHLAEILAAHPRPRTAVIHDRNRSLAAILQSAYPDTDVTAVKGTRPINDLHVEFAARGRPGLIIDDTRKPRRRVRIFKAFFWHLDEGGAYVVREVRRGLTGESGTRSPAADITRVILDLVEQRHDDFDDLRRGSRHDNARLASAIGEVTRGARHLSVTNTHRTHLKLRESELRAVLDGRGPGFGRIVTTIDPVRFRSACTLRLPPGTTPARMPTTYEVPELTLREYRGVTAAPGQLVLHDNLILPEAFRHNLHPRLRNRDLREVAARFADPGVAGVPPLPVLEGSYYHLDNEVVVHFGHVMTEQLSRLWGWQQAKAAHPDLKALVGVYVGPQTVHEPAPWGFELLEAGGIQPSDVVVIRRPTIVEHLVSASPMYSAPSFIHPDLTRTWLAMGDSLERRASAGVRPSRIFISRRDRVRQCHNTAEVEQFFRAYGFDVVFPEEFSLPDQVRMFRQADVIAGFAGTGLFGTLWCTEPKRVIALTHDSYTARNEYMIASLLGHELHLISSEPDIAHPTGGWTEEAYRSPFTFDLNGLEGQYLREVLSGPR